MRKTMRRGLFILLVLGSLLASGPASAQTRERVKISNVRMGLPFGATAPAGVRSDLFKAGHWAPIYADLECVRDTEEPLLLVVEVKDVDDALTTASVEIGPMIKGDRLAGNELGRIPYLKPGSSYSSLTVQIKGARTDRTYGETTDRSFSGIESPAFVVLGIGNNLPGLRFPLAGADQGENPATRNGWIQSAHLLDIGRLPDQWFGYDVVDLMVLGTGTDRSFWEALSAPQHERRRKAIVEWVRRGGRLILSIGSNADLLEAEGLREFKELLPAAIPAGSKRMVTGQPFEWKLSSTNERNDAIRFADGKTEFPVVSMSPRADRNAKVILDDGAGRPLAIQSSYGMGRVTVIGFDLDRTPFVDWAKRAAFWENIVNQCGYILPAANQKPERYSSIAYDDLATRLQGSLDFFEGVPVVSFGWVALFILIYIILIGPLDYLFLKKVIRKLEWTWVTFPVIVISVSAAAYFAAYALKGKDLKSNKVDVVDIDLMSGRIDGNTWFTLFSPRIQNYTIGIEPASSQGEVPGWFNPGNPRTPLVSWQGNVERNRFGGSSGGFLAKRYEYETGADPTDFYAIGLKGVPIQVWTTKTFYSQWSTGFDPNRPPIQAEFSVSKTADSILSGTLSNNLPVDSFTDVVLFWRGKAYELPKEFPIGSSRAISFSSESGADSPENIKDWLISQKRYPEGGQAWSPPATSRGFQSSNNGTTSNPNFRLWPLLFADFATDSYRQHAPNATLRKLDQSWRVTADHSEQAILVLRLPTREDNAETITRSALSPSRLWLGKLPISGEERPEIPGRLKQETYIRVFIPVKIAKK